MNLKFSKNASKDIEVFVQEGTEQKPFSYIGMIKSLLAGENVSTEFTEEISDDEKVQIDELIDRIKQITGTPIAGSLNLFEN